MIFVILCYWEKLYFIGLFRWFCLFVVSEKECIRGVVLFFLRWSLSVFVKVPIYVLVVLVVKGRSIYNIICLIGI